MESVCHAFGPPQWGYAISNPEKTYNSSCPTLNQLDSLYGNGSSAKWIAVQFTGLYILSSSDDAELVDAIKSFSALFAGEVKGYKLSVLLLFFSRFAAGHYGANIWSAFDLRRIASAFRSEFLPERNRELEEMEYQRRTSQFRFALEERHRSYISYDDYLALQAKTGIDKK